MSPRLEQRDLQAYEVPDEPLKDWLEALHALVARMTNECENERVKLWTERPSSISNFFQNIPARCLR